MRGGRGSGGARSRTPTFSSFRLPNFAKYFVAASLSTVGGWMQNVGLAWLVLDLGHSGSALGAVVGVRFLPVLLLGPWGGLVADRFDTRTLTTWTQSALAVLSGVLAAFTVAGGTALWVIFVISALLGVATAVDMPARQSLVYELVGRDLLANAISLSSLQSNIGRIGGPVLAGALISTTGVGTCFVVNALTYALFAVVLLWMDTDAMVPAEKQPRAKGQIRDGLRYVAGERDLYLPLALIAIAGAFAWEFQITLPLLATKAFEADADTLGLMFACTGVGAIVGGFVNARRVVVTTRTLARSAIGWGAAINLAALMPTIEAEYLVLLVVGYGTISFNSLGKVCLQSAAAPVMRGRVISLWIVAWQGSTPIGGPLVGWIGEHLGARWSLVAGGVPTMLAGLVVLWLVSRPASRSPAGPR